MVLQAFVKILDFFKHYRCLWPCGNSSILLQKLYQYMYHTTFLSGPDPAFLQHKYNVKCGSGTHNLGPETHSFIPLWVPGCTTATLWMDHWIMIRNCVKSRNLIFGHKCKFLEQVACGSWIRKKKLIFDYLYFYSILYDCWWIQIF